jgi:hypothetical protein
MPDEPGPFRNNGATSGLDSLGGFQHDLIADASLTDVNSVLKFACETRSRFKLDALPGLVYCRGCLIASLT